jgi:uncharacterized repeat protein (TIGR01451 family)
VTVDADYPGAQLSNTAEIDSSPLPDPDPTDDSSTDVDDVDRLADLGISIDDAPDPVTLGGDVTYSITVTNAGPSDTSGVVATIALPAGATFVSADAACAPPALGLVVCTVGDLPVGGTALLDVVLNPTVAGTLNVGAFVVGSDADPVAGNNADSEATEVVALPPTDVDVSVVLADSPDPVIESNALAYTLTVGNDGPGTASAVEVTQQLPAGTTFVSASAGCSEAAGLVTCTVGNLNNSATAVRSVVVTAPPAVAALSSSAHVTTTSTDTDATNDDDVEATAMLPTTVTTDVDLAVTIADAPDPVDVGGSLTYTVGVSNAGPDDATDATVTISLPAGVTFTSAVPGQGTCSQAAGVVTCPLGALASGASTTITVVVTPTAAGSITANASVATTDDDNVAANDTASTTTMVNAPTPTTPSADLSIVKVDVPDPVSAGERITYTMTVTNAGPGDALDVVVTDPVPAATTVDQVLDGGSLNGGVVSWNLGSVAAGASVSVRLIVLVDVNHDGDLTNTATVASPTADPDPSDNSATAVTTDDPAGVDLALDKTVDDTSAAIGDTITYTIVVSNAGPADATGVEVEDDLPKGLDFVSAKADRGAFDDATGIWTVGDLDAGDEATLTLRARITQVAGPALTNLAAVASLDQTDETPANDEAEAELEVLVEDVRIIDPHEEGEALAYTGLNVTMALWILLALLVIGGGLIWTGSRLSRGTHRAS